MSSIVTELETPASWQADLAHAFTNPDALLAYLKVPQHRLANQVLHASPFEFRVTRSFAAKMRAGDADDPLLRQVLPRTAELVSPSHYSHDPVGDQDAIQTPGLIQKYQGRALLIATGACAIHCRYCFRRAFPYAAHLGHSVLDDALRQLSQMPDVREVILSGGDPLLLNDRRLGELIDRLESLPHIKRLRIHSRLPVVLPSRITQNLCQILSGSRLQTVVVIHANHPNEIQDDVLPALKVLTKAGIPLLNQTVLLRGINDCTETLRQLSEALFSAGVLPYYLHLLDTVQGASHFEIEPSQATLVFDELRRQLPGYLVPRLVREIRGEPYKSLIY